MGIASTPDEVWRDIPGLEGRYQASSLGRIRNVARIVRGTRCRWQRSKILVPFSNNGYPTVYTCVNGARRPVSIHRLVCLAFHGPPPSPECVVAHGDGSRTNNVPANLRWATRSENQLDRTLHGRANPSRAVDEQTAREIISRLNAGEGQRAIANALGVSRWTVQHIGISSYGLDI